MSSPPRPAGRLTAHQSAGETSPPQPPSPARRGEHKRESNQAVAPSPVSADIQPPILPLSAPERGLGGDAAGRKPPGPRGRTRDRARDPPGGVRWCSQDPSPVSRRRSSRPLHPYVRIRPGSVTPPRAPAAANGPYAARMPPESRRACPECGGPLEFGGMALCHREEDDRRTCRTVWGCSGRHVWWKWADRPADPLEVCPYPDLMNG